MIYQPTICRSPENGPGSPSGTETPSLSPPAPPPSAPPSPPSEGWWKTAGLPEAYHGDLNVTRYGSLEDYVKGSGQAWKVIGEQDPTSRLSMYMQANAGKPEAMDSVYTALGRPAKPEEYGLKAADGAPEWLGNWTKGVSEKLFPLGANKAQMEALGAYTNETFAGVIKAENDAKATAIAATETALRQKWGNAFDANSGLVKGLVQKLGGDKAAELQDKLNLHFGDSPFMFDALLEIAKGRGEPVIPAVPGGGKPSGGAADVAGIESELRAFDANLENAKAMGDRSAVNRQDVLNRRREIVERLGAAS